MKNKLVINNLVILKNGSRLRQTYTECYYNKFFLELLIFFYEKNFILGYIFVGNFKVRIFFKYYKDKGIFDNLMIPDKLNSMVTYKKMLSLYVKGLKLVNTFVVILNSEGFFLLSDFMKMNVRMGGFVLFVLYL